MKNKTFLSAALAFFMLAGFNQTTQATIPQMPSEETVSKCKVAPTPPMGWNSFDAYDCRINEQEFKAIVDYMADNLKQHGWEYAVIDYCWFNDNPGGWNNPNLQVGRRKAQAFIQQVADAAFLVLLHFPRVEDPT